VGSWKMQCSCESPEFQRVMNKEPDFGIPQE
jgi:hypothetical protein